MRFALLVLAVCLAASPVRAAEPFDAVRSIFEKHCLSCHNDNELKGKLSLSTEAAARRGGESESPLLTSDLAANELLAQVTGPEPLMPKDRPPLSKAEVEAIRTWLAAGAAWPKDAVLRDRRFDPSTWWSFQPLRPVTPPAVAGPLAAEVRNPIDRFVLATLVEKGLTPSPEADRRTLIRRLSYDLLGLPPAPEEIDQFVNDPDPLAYERLVDRLLASPHYGERWARHWLDVVHFGETHGYDKDQPRTNAWPYRDYVIRAFNEDRPYGRFLREQLAGDVLYPEERDGLEGPGFIAAGPWDLIGHAEVPEEKTDGKIARHLDRDDMITNTIQTFTSLTVQCAQCHDHKFDPILQEDYYSLQAVFAALDRTNRKYDIDPQVARRRRELEGRRGELAALQKQIEERTAERAGPRWMELQRLIAAKEKEPTGSHPLAAQFGYHSGIASEQETAKWVQIELPEEQEIAAIVLHPCHDDFNNIGDGFGFPVRYKVEVAGDTAFTEAVRPVLDQTGADVLNPGLRAERIDAPGRARVVRITATRLAPRLNDFIFALSEVEILDAAGRSIAATAKVTSLDSIEAPPRWRQTNLVDGYYPGVVDVGQPLEELKRERDQLKAASLTAEDRETLDRTTRDLASIASGIALLPPQQTAYVAAIHTGTGTFRGTGAGGGKPRPIHRLLRGSVLAPAEEIGPGAISFLSALPGGGRFHVPTEAGEGARRVALAEWIAHPDHPLTWRSIVNRVWHYHFGRGLVETANDFGRNGSPPSHPLLLDWLAREFRGSDGSIKHLHRLIVTSRTYRQVSLDRPDNAVADADNRFLWRMNRRRLDAESVRDSVLAVAGKLRPDLYGTSFQDFVIDKPAHSPHYEYHLFDPENPAGHRRSVYRFIVRSQPQPFMTTLDCADPSMQVDRRNESLSPLQALALLYNDLMLVMAEHFAKRLEAQSPTLEGQLETGFRLTTGTAPAADELSLLADYARTHGLANACRVLLNLNEFLFVE